MIVILLIVTLTLTVRLTVRLSGNDVTYLIYSTVTVTVS